MDAAGVAEAALELATAALAEGGPVCGVGIATQRATTVVWDRDSGRPVAPAIGWQDLRTVGTCLALQAEGIRLAPNMSATKLAAILDDVDPDRSAAGGLCFGTVDSWVAWTLAGGAGSALHVTDATNAAVTGLPPATPCAGTTRSWSGSGCPPRCCRPSSTPRGRSAWPRPCPVPRRSAGSPVTSKPPWWGRAAPGPGLAKATFGTGGMSMCTGEGAPCHRPTRFSGRFLIVAWQREGKPVWGVEAIMLSAGTCVEWLRDDLGVIATAEESSALAGECTDTGEAWFVPALLGMGTPVWDFGARGTLLGLTPGTGRAELAGRCSKGWPIAAPTCWRRPRPTAATGGALRVDGGMSANGVFVSALAEATGRVVEVSAEREATTLGAGFLAGMATGTWRDTDEVAAAVVPSRAVEPTTSDDRRRARRERWLARQGAGRGHRARLLGIDF